MNKGKKNINLILGLILAGIAIIPALVGIFWTPYSTEAMDVSLKLSAPGMSHLLGCDNYGRDILSRLMAGSKITLIIGIGTVFFGCSIGTMVGALTGYYGGLVDNVLMRVNDVLFSFPSILLAMVFVSLTGAGNLQLVIALGIAFIPSYARVVRAEFIRNKNMDYVMAARLAGASNLRIIFVHILPNTIKVLVSSILIGFNNAVLAEAGLSFLGIGVKPPEASLGSMLSDAQTYLFSRPSMVVYPGVALILMILGIALISKEIK